MTSAIILLLVFIVTSLTSMRQIQPIREMVQATRAYAAGNFDVRMQDADRGDEIGELAAGFNNMAALWRRRSASAGTSSPTSPMN